MMQGTCNFSTPENIDVSFGSASEKEQFDELIQRVAPSIGFFGDYHSSKLQWQIGKYTDELVFTIDQKKSLLNIGGITIFDRHGNALIPEKHFNAEFSSSKPVSANPFKVFNNKGFHSFAEDYPFIKITFHRPIFLSSIEVKNRGDKWGSRAKFLTIKQYCFGLLKKEYSPFTEEYKNDFLFRLPKIGVSNKKLAELLSTPEQSRTAVLKTILTSMKGKRLCADTIRTAHEVLSLWSTTLPEGDLLELELEILAVIFANQLADSMTLSLLPYTKMLNTQKNLGLIEGYINDNLKIMGKRQIKLTKHGIARKGELVDNIEVVMETLLRVMSLLEKLDYEPQLAYGTLLGAHRDKGFIEHDDDVDILIKLSNDNIDKATALKLRDEMLQKLPESEYFISKGNVKNLNVHVYCRKTKVMIDVFPYWFDNVEAQLYMEKMNVRGISADIFAHRGSITLYGHDVPTPGDIEGFLTERYGPNWNFSDKYHEWPWKLIDREEK